MVSSGFRSQSPPAEASFCIDSELNWGHQDLLVEVTRDRAGTTCSRHLHHLRTTPFSLGRNCKGHAVRPSLLRWTPLSGSPIGRCSSGAAPVPEGARFPRAARFWTGSSSITFLQFDEICSQWLSNRWLKLNPQLPF